MAGGEKLGGGDGGGEWGLDQGFWDDLENLESNFRKSWKDMGGEFDETGAPRTKFGYDPSRIEDEREKAEEKAEGDGEAKGEKSEERKEKEERAKEKLKGEKSGVWSKTKNVIITVTLAAMLVGVGAGIAYGSMDRRNAQTVVNLDANNPAVAEMEKGQGNIFSRIADKLHIDWFGGAGEKLVKEYNEAKDATRNLAEGSKEWNQYWILKDGGISGETTRGKLGNLGEKVENSWDYAFLWGAITGEGEPAGKAAEQVLASGIRYIQEGDDEYRYRVAERLNKGVDEKKVTTFKPVDGTFVSEYYLKNEQTGEVALQKSTRDIEESNRTREGYEEGEYLDMTEAISKDWKANICKLIGMTEEEVAAKGGRYVVREKCGQVGVYFPTEKKIVTVTSTQQPTVTSTQPTTQPITQPIVRPEVNPEAKPEVKPVVEEKPEVKPVVEEKSEVEVKQKDAANEQRIIDQVPEEVKEGGQQIMGPTGATEENPLGIITEEPAKPNYGQEQPSVITEEQRAEGVVSRSQGNGETPPIENRVVTAIGNETVAPVVPAGQETTGMEIQDQANREQAGQTDVNWTDSELDGFLSRFMEG